MAQEWDEWEEDRVLDPSVLSRVDWSKGQRKLLKFPEKDPRHPRKLELLEHLAPPKLEVQRAVD